MVRLRAVFLVFSLTLSFSLIFGSPVHALVPHDHGDHHQKNETLSWQVLHSSLRHEDKSALPTTDPLVLITMVIAIAIAFSVRENETVDSMLEHVRRGVAQHRRFG